MGARWPWEARCKNGHVYGNFSGGADECYDCGEPPVEELACPHWAGPAVGPCDCRQWMEKRALEALGERK